MVRALHKDMKKTQLLALCVILLWPGCLKAGDQKAETNANERYVVEKIEYIGIEESKVSSSIRDDAQKMVGEKYSEKKARDIAKRIHRELRRYDVEFRVTKGEKPEQVIVVFQVERVPSNSLNAALPILVYHSKEGFSGSLEIPVETHHNVFTFGLVSDADQLLERNAGLRLRYEHRKLGTDVLRFRMDFDSYHEKFNAATESALAQRQDLPGIYRSRQNFEPSLTVLPSKSLSLSAGVSFQRLQFQYPALHTQTAYSGIAGIQYHPVLESLGEFRQDFSAAYSLRTATRVLTSDFVYTRHLFSVDYSLAHGRNYFGAHFTGGLLNGTAPLFERFSFGNSTTLRGWDKFDVSPVGGSRAAHGSLEYRYRHIGIFYDVGTVWESKQFSQVRHGLGFGWASRHLFVSLAFPVRLHNVSPVIMMGLRD
jgi:hypothetical protein